MNVSATSQKLNAGTCPHGNPIGTCPICAGLSGGGGGLANNKARQAGEMTYNQCYAVWQNMLRAKANAEEQKLLQKLEYMKAQGNIKSFSERIYDKISALNDKAIALEASGTIFAKIQTTVVKTIGTFLNIVATTSNIIRNTFNFIQQKFIDVSDKILYVCGDLKAKIQKVLSKKDPVSKKIKSLFSIFNPFNIENEDKRIDEEKLLFKLRTTLSSIKEKFKNKAEVENDNSD